MMRLLFIDPHVRFVELTYGSFSFVTVITGKQVSMSISVIEERILERLSSNKNFVKLSVDNEQSITLNAIYNDRTKADVSDEAKWTSSDEGIAVVKDGVITAISSGEVEIIAEYQGKTVTIYVTVTK